MKANRRRLAGPLSVAIAMTVAVGAWLACRPRAISAFSAETLREAAPPTWTCAGAPVSFGPVIPPDFAQSNQEQIDCFAWSEFTSLNWPAAGGDGGQVPFGAPGDPGAVQWQTFATADSMFPPDGGKPPDWGTQSQITDDCLAEAGIDKSRAGQVVPLMSASKASTQFRLSGSGEAFPFSGPAWLGAKNGTNVWYEVRVSQPEYDFVLQNGFYNANTQQAWVDAGKPFVLPQGSLTDGGIGAIELKAAWMEVPDPQNPKWRTFKVSQAVVPDPSSQKCRATQVALVGLHIIHKTANQPTWIWATFEHKNNVPDNGVDAGTTDWSFFDPSCQPKTLNNLPKSCTPDGGSTVTVGCAPNQPPPYYIGEGCPPPVPIQVTRMNRLDSTAAGVNQAMQQAISGAYPGSVWSNYQLINVIWSTNPPPPPTTSVPVPAVFLSPQPSASTPLVNTTLETYFQTDPSNPFQPSNCIVCHDDATVASTTAVPNPTGVKVFGSSTRTE